ncbi:amino acid permease-domain-containing protein [Podospora fimiseda]|uniref:Amino acid permease-domain-containing protein n=1 Tax=Podospora fimiseda TaxID=252190 RepID=A0AAN7H2W5_9PEZI|nr:amino acid permease-domain-containing protein [Podospora fimiseda]
MRSSSIKEGGGFAGAPSHITRGSSIRSTTRSMATSTFYDEDDHHSQRFRDWVDSFRRDPGRRIAPASVIYSIEDSHSTAGGSYGVNEHPQHGWHYLFDLHAANLNTANTSLSRELKGRHLQMIAIGGSIGAGLFVASGQSLTCGGPASVLLAYAFVGVMLYCTIQALGELAVAFPVAGSFSAYSTRFLDPAWGFAMGWNYALQWLIVLPLEIIAASITVGYWNTHIDRSVFVTLFLAAIVTINLFGVKGYGEAEFIFSIIKVVAIIGFILLGIVINIGGFPNDGFIGGRYWQDPGPFNNGFKGFCGLFVTAAFAFTGTELVGLAAAEAVNPVKSLPTAIKQVFWRITLFYMLSLTLIGLLVPFNHPDLLGAESVADISASPFVIAIQSASISVLPGVMNSVILVAVISVGNSAVFGSSRTLAALADQGQAPRFLSYIDRRGRPLAAIIVASSLGLLGYLTDLKENPTILNWLLAVSGLSSIFTWSSICLAHIRFRKAWALKHRPLSDLAFLSQAGVKGSYLGLFLNILVLIAQVWTAAYPVPPTIPPSVKMDDLEVGSNGVGKVVNDERDRVYNFFLQCLCLPIVVAFYLGYKLWFRTKIVKLSEIDLDTGRRKRGAYSFRYGGLPILVDREEDEKRKGWPRWKKIYKFLC